MKLDKADQPKIIVLGVLMAILLGYGAYSLMGKKASAAPKTPSVREAAVSNRPAGNPAAPKKDAPAVVKLQAQVAFVPLDEPAPRKDPFNPCVSMEAPTSRAPRPLMSQQRNMAGLPPFRLPQSPLSIGVRQSSDGSAPAPEADPQFVLTGIIQGVTDVAIIRAGDSGRHIVRVGQLIDGKYFVKFIGRDRVVLTQGTRSIDLRLGGGTNAS